MQAFSYLKDISLTWTLSFLLEGKWDFNFYVPLPAPVSFIGVNFGFSVYFAVNVDLYGRGNPIANCVYNFELGVNAGT